MPRVYVVNYLQLFANLRSPLVITLMSDIPYLMATSLESHIPKANQLYSLGSIPAVSSTCGCIIPAPSISNRFSLLPIWYRASISNPGSVNGKYQGLSLRVT